MDEIEEIELLDKESDFYLWLEWCQYYHEVIVPTILGCNQ